MSQQLSGLLSDARQPILFHDSIDLPLDRFEEKGDEVSGWLSEFMIFGRYIE
jgi:hypothetical protein